MTLFLQTKRRQDAEWLLDWSRNLAAYGISYSAYEKYRHRYGVTPPKDGSGAPPPRKERQ